MSSANSTVANTAYGKKFFVSLKASATTYSAPGTAGSAKGQGVVVHDMGKNAVDSTGATYRLVKQVLAAGSQATASPWDTFYIKTSDVTSDWVSQTL